ncbi:hypothetical protein JNUCC83_05975 [Vagococcus sp. JNUCC 83]
MYASKSGEKHLLEVEPHVAETTIESIERFGKEELDLAFNHIELIDIIEQTTQEYFEQNDTLFLYRASLSPKTIIPKLSHSHIVYWLPLEKAQTLFSANFLSKVLKKNE